jgi:DNA-binding MarR family transcriptional regulator
MGEMLAKPKPEDCNCLTIRQAARVVTQHYDRHLATIGLTGTQFWLLAKLVYGGPASINEIAKLMMSDRTTVGRTLGPLEREGLIEIRIDPDDRRSRRAEPTEAGRTRVQSAFPVMAAAKRSFEAAYGVERSAALRSLLLDITPDLFTAEGAAAMHRP